MLSEPLQEGTLLNDRYRILRILGQGGMGTVYLAEHTRLDTRVAVKEVRGALPNTAELREALARCEQEGRLLVNLRHPNLPHVMDAFVENDRFYLVMEYLEGVTLEDMLKERNDAPLDVTAVVSYGVQIASVLSYLHQQQPPVIFRDLKPANVMALPDGTIRLIDFGIARRFQKGARADTEYLGSVGYSPPEQFGERQTDPRSDIYALGATLHHLLTGRHPSIRPFEFISARSLNPAVPVSLSSLIDWCVAAEPKARPATMEEVKGALEAIQMEFSAPLFRTPGYKPRAVGRPYSLHRNRSMVAPALLIVLGVGALGYFAVTGLRKPVATEEVKEPPKEYPPVVTPNPSPTPTPPPLPTAGHVAVHREPGIPGKLEYWFEGGKPPEFSPVPLEIFDAQGVATLDVPENFVVPRAKLCVRNLDSGQVVRWPLAELYRLKKQMIERANRRPNLLNNGSFQQGKRYWQLIARDIIASFQTRRSNRGRAARVTLDSGKSAGSQASLVHHRLMLVENGTYRVKFLARADSDREIGVTTRLNAFEGGSTGLDKRASLGTQWRQIDWPFTVTIPVSQRKRHAVLFRFTPPKPVKEVYLAGAFNGWNFKANPLSRSEDDNTWQTLVPLEAGVYQYKFVADNEWYTDPSAPTVEDGAGHTNSVRTVAPPPAQHRLSFMLGPNAGWVELREVSVQAESESSTPKPLPRIDVKLKASDMAPKAERESAFLHVSRMRGANG